MAAKGSIRSIWHYSKYASAFCSLISFYNTQFLDSTACLHPRSMKFLILIARCIICSKFILRHFKMSSKCHKMTSHLMHCETIGTNGLRTFSKNRGVIQDPVEHPWLNHSVIDLWIYLFLASFKHFGIWFLLLPDQK